tara:strand:- start:544 stop:777 length:234 start_codon:yes stop_codon:yes gene_type:complete
MSTHNIEDIANNIIHNTLETIEKNLDKLIGDMDLMCALKFVGAVMDLRDRQYTYIHTAQNRINDCVKKPKRNETDGL